MAAFTRLLALAALGAGCGGLVGCRREKEAPPVPPPPTVTVAKPVMMPVQPFYEYNGHLDTTQMVEIRARVKGLLTIVHFKEGTEVHGPLDAGLIAIPGEELYTIDDREYVTAVKKAEAEVEKAKADIGNWDAQIALAKAELKRADLAASQSATAQTDVDKAKATLGVNTAQRASAVANHSAAEAALHSANIQLGYTRIRAPISGRINRTMVDESNLVGQSEATLLTTIVRMDELYVNFDVPERDQIEYQRKHQGKRLLTVPVEVGVATEEGYPHKGFIDFRENRVDIGSGTIHIRGRIPNPIDPASRTRPLYPGLYARVRMPSGEPQLRPVIPEDAIMTGQEGRYVYVVGPDKQVAKRAVALGIQVYRSPPPIENKPPAWLLTSPGDAAKPTPVKSVMAIEKGLGPDDVVIVNGLQKTRPGGEVVPERWEFTGPK
jgi:multidrug efflux system membrane fusion protein